MRRILPSLTSLEAFEAVARLGQVTKAADELGRTQSAVSRQISNLEAFARRPLFIRDKKRLILNDAGKFFFKVVGRLLGDLEVETARLLTFGSTDRVLRIGVLPTFGSRWLVPKLSSLADEYDEFELHLVKGLGRSDFAKRGVDAAIECSAEPPEDLETHELIVEKVVAVITPQHYEEVKARGSAIFDKLHMPSREQLWETWIEKRGQPRAESALRFENYSMMIEAVCLGLGVAVLPTLYIARELASGRLVAPFGDPIESGRSYWLTFPPDSPRRQKVERFADWLLATAKASTSPPGAVAQ
jgi:DNA-binding transcriptional LysR family regulator